MGGGEGWVGGMHEFVDGCGNMRGGRAGGGDVCVCVFLTSYAWLLTSGPSTPNEPNP